MPVKGTIKTGEYYDSVTLMIVGQRLRALKGVIDAAVVMGTNGNRAILKAAGLYLPEFEKSGDTDLLIGISVENEGAADEALRLTDSELAKVKNKGDDEREFRPRSIEGAIKAMPGANIALISIAGRYAGLEAERALDAGLHVMLFSDNVSVRSEIELKKKASEKGLLVMGPDCGTAIINGVPLAFANVVNRGGIGIVAASGTGLQEVSAIISGEGGGVSQAIGTGSRDVKKDVGGIMFLDALKALAQDDKTKVICLVSKPPHEGVLDEIARTIREIKKPVVSVFLGKSSGLKVDGLYETRTLEEAALTAVAISKGRDPKEVGGYLRSRAVETGSLAKGLSGKLKGRQKFIRGLFSGGTFCSEAQVIFAGKLEGIYSNAPVGDGPKLKNSLKSEFNTLVDLGEDEFTVGRPHPMIDYSLRNARVLEEAKDPETAIILLDVVLGYGSNMNPHVELQPVIREASENVLVVCSVTGTDKDPQRKGVVEAALKGAGAIVMPSNAAACELCLEIVEGSKCQ